MFFKWQCIIKCDTYSQWATIHLYENKITNFAEKMYGTGNDHVEKGNSDPERPIPHALSHLNLLTRNHQMIIYILD